MLEKEVVKFTRDGMETQNLSDGTTEKLTVSEWGKQTRYRNDTSQYASKQERYVKGGSADTPTPTSMATKPQIPLEQRLAKQKTMVYRQKKQSVKGTQDVHMDILGSSASSKLLEKKRYGMLKSKLKQSGRSASAFANAQNNEQGAVADEGAARVTNTALSMPRQTARTAKRLKAAKQKQQAAQQAAAQQRRIQQTAMQIRRTQQAASQAATQAATTTATTTATATASSGGTVLAVVAGIIAAVVLLVVVICATAVLSINQPSDDLSSYVLELDNAFLAEANAAGQKDGFAHQVNGAYLVHTNASDVQLVLNAKGCSELLTNKVKEEVKKIHAVLNTYSVADGRILINPPATDENPNPPPVEVAAVVVTIQTFSVAEKREELGLSDSQKSALDNMLQISHQTGGGTIYAGGWVVSEDVHQYDSLISKYAKQYGISAFVPVVHAVMMKESGGKGTDPMQASESGYNTRFPREPGSITEPEYSIDCGVHTLADCIKEAKCSSPEDTAKLSLALQGYNFGNGYIPWAIAHYGGWSETCAAAFSKMKREELGWSSYGDVKYVQHVMRYLSVSGVSVAGTAQFIWPVPGFTKLSSYWGDDRGHQGIDIASSGIYGKPIVAAESGKVTAAVCVDDGSGYGLHVDIQHEKGFMTRYGHCSRVIVSNGQQVTKGQVIAFVGNTGRSSGPHLHFEIHKDGKAVDPLDYYDRKGVSPE